MTEESKELKEKVAGKKEAPLEKDKKEQASATLSSYLGVIRVRGEPRVDKKIRDTLLMLNLNNQHNLIIVPNKPNIVGMLKKAKDYITWGEISSEVKKKVEATKKKEDQKVFRLHPPRGGFERKGIKVPFTVGGVLGYRGNAINDLISKML